ncbi:hypothetical protein [Hymenobacter rubripertinctus]|uniref:Uncharacterized protein n=1 Tax=Hymenobacter rubripertinctus TaxID=2029981 RepID=A0A418R303_9BACT|nr:hypothetical protein [Hymenobacter rubripertinctus]RIY11812.1 hypothetical protein D0T11_06555 [Hymenobacter rubripertinctus]
MKKYYAYLSTALIALTALSSCNRANYAFKPASSAYHGTEVARTAPSVPELSEATVEAPAAAVKPAPETAVIAPAIVARQRVSAAVKSSASQRVAPVAKTSALQSRLVAKVAKRIDHQNVASTTQAQSKAGKAAIVTLVGLVLLLLGVAGVPIVGLIGLIALIVGIVLLIVALVNG